MNKIYIFSAMLIIFLWSGLGHSHIVTFLGICTAFWLPISLKLYTFLLRWLPLIEGHQSHPTPYNATQDLGRFATSLITAGATIFLLILLPPLQAVAGSLALNMIALLLLFYYQDRWIPITITFLMLLSALAISTLTHHMTDTIYGAILGWILAWAALTFLSFFYRRNYLAQSDILLFTACSAWCGFKGLLLFLPLTFIFLWGYAFFSQKTGRKIQDHDMNHVGIIVYHFLCPPACMIALITTSVIQMWLLPQ